MEKQIALVTGSNRGIGYEVAKGLLLKGYKVIITSRKEDDGKKALSELKSYGDAIYHTLDVSDIKSVGNIKHFVATNFDRLDVLINNAGINYDSWHNASNANLEEVQNTIDTNLMGPWRMAQAFIPLMKKNNYGRIVNVSSGAGAISEMGGGTPGYSISKAALNVLTIKLSSELSSYNILVNSVCPGWVRTAMGGESAPRSPEKGAETIIWAAELSHSKQSGKFFRDMMEIQW